ncbi:unnamed protein product [Urochloa decumbens]|uniref:Pectinesterase inhibitor domain-containing protein n=1 Tax=Urochloa decumbens TaxID=240449 RepID=A0ABC9BXC5_9POAL
MTAERACTAVTGTPHMRDLCLRTLLPSGAGTSSGTAAAAAPVPVTRYAAAAVQAALGSYAATVTAATSLLDGGLVPADDEKAAVGDCMVGYGRARIAMARVAGDLALAAADGCGDEAAAAAGLIRAGYTAGLRGMDGCRRSLIDYPASPLIDRNLADRNMTLLAALLCNLVPAALG